jgi:hypothetical protein
VLALAITHNWSIRQLDISNAFLHGFLAEDLYMAQSPGFVFSQHPDYVCRLHKSIYGLKQASRAWFQWLLDFLLKLGFQSSQADHSLFICCHGISCIFVLIYVDDIIVTSNTSTGFTWLFAYMKSVFPVKDLGPLHYVLGIEIRPTIDGILLTQQKYIVDLFKETNKHNSKGCVTPMATSPPLSKAMGTLIPSGKQYRQVIGALQYITLTRPDIAFNVNKLAQFMHCATDVHWQAYKHLLRYLHHTASYGLLISMYSSLALHCFSDSHWAGSPDDRCSTNGYLVYLGNNLIS